MAELFAGVGGFRLGLEKAGWKVTWSNQWEPSTKTQHASECYERNFKSGIHTCEDIAKVADSLQNKDKKWVVPDFDLLVGGFPCQDYSVAKTASQAAGIHGKKGVLWWEIRRFLELKRPPYFFLENVDRLLKSPTSQRGRDFAIMLATVSELGYSVEWRVVNAADYGFPQKRRRVYIVGVHKSKLKKGEFQGKSWILSEGVIASALPVSQFSGDESPAFKLESDIVKLSDSFARGFKLSPFLNAGVMQGGEVWTYSVVPKFRGKSVNLEDILIPEKDVPDEYFVEAGQISTWKYLKGAKREERTNPGGGKYFYTEGAIPFPDHTDTPARTILTGEGGSTPSRFKHIIMTPSGRYRRLTPVELERLNGFPDNWTKGMPDGRRAFMMGNALVVGVVAKIGKSLKSFAEKRN